MMEVEYHKKNRKLLQGKILLFRKKGKSYRQIEELLGVSRSTIHYWARHVELTQKQKFCLDERRRVGRLLGALKQKQNFLERVDSVRKQAFTESKIYISDALWVAGVSLYMAEGRKQKPWNQQRQLSFVNSDPNMAILFIVFCKKYFHVKDSDFIYDLYIHKDSDAQGARNYWALELKILSVLIRTYYKNGNKNSRRHNRFENYHGVISVTVKKSSLFNHKIAFWWQYMLESLFNPGSSNGRTPGFGPGYGGSNPSPGAL